MKLKSLRLENIACFEDITLDFCHDETGEPCNWVVILGENGTGKSTLLRMAAATTLGYRPLAPEPQSPTIPFIGLEIHKFLRDKKKEQLSSLIELIHEDHPQKYLLRAHQDGSSSMTSPDAKIPDFLPQGTEVIGHVGIKKRDPFMYGCSKSLPPSKWIINNDNRRAVKCFGRLFGYNNSPAPNEWLYYLYNRSIHPSSTESDISKFTLAVSIIEKLLPDIRFHEVSINGEFLVKYGATIIPIDDLSDGYRALSDWSLDLVRWLFEIFPDSSDPLMEEGVVLIDEIDLHLHPHWQREVVEQIRATFHNLQFIVTSHSPFIAQDMMANDKLIALKRDKNSAVYAEHGMGFAERWRVDQILTSWLFDLPTTRGEEAGSDEADYQKLLEVKVAGKLTEVQRARLVELKSRLDKDPLGETRDDQELLDAADALLGALQKK